MAHTDGVNGWLEKIRGPVILAAVTMIVAAVLAFIIDVRADMAELRGVDSRMERILLERNEQRLREVKEFKTAQAALRGELSQLDKQVAFIRDRIEVIGKDVAASKAMDATIAELRVRLLQLETLFSQVQASGVIGRLDAMEELTRKLARSLLVRDPDARYPYINPHP